MLIQEKNKHSIIHNNLGFKISSPVSETVCFIKWSTIETIIFSPNTHYENSAQWIVYLNKPAQYSLNQNAWWLNKISFFLKNKKYKKLRMRDDMNKDFYEFPEIIERYLNKKEEINYYEDNRKGELVSKKITIKGDKTITEEYWKPKRSNELPWKMLYDRYNRTVEEIYKRDGSI
ncbi:hypothetical protein [Flavobacterium sp. LM4]|uniref:hypothetical protein n=1 Tax=Flavobacterium sp. LM4 TaxID=1938609 RepID=UPI000992BA77|nr:hypothetical protein [Flavobacterium sp. LM4]OOV19516.1 hypothetical protein BXU10_07640 [Flavobacterium sp. LM4]